jgi:hypothetical protein
LIAFLFWLVNNVTAQTSPEKHLKKTTELNEVSLKTKKAIEQKQIDHFNFADQPSLNTGSVLEGIKNYQV